MTLGMPGGSEGAGEGGATVSEERLCRESGVVITVLRNYIGMLLASVSACFAAPRAAGCSGSVHRPGKLRSRCGGSAVRRMFSGAAGASVSKIQFRSGRISSEFRSSDATTSDQISSLLRSARSARLPSGGPRAGCTLWP